MSPAPIEILATVLFGLALVHTFSAKLFHGIGSRFPEGSVKQNVFHLLGEVEVVFGFWAGLLVAGIAILEGTERAIGYVQGLNFTEPAFVFAIMAIASTRPVIHFANSTISLLARLLPLPGDLGFYAVVLFVGPLLGSFITEPAAMTVTALLLKRRYYERGISARLMYATLGLLFVNVSIGGTLTHFAAPPVLMVAGKWGLGIGEMVGVYGWKAALAIAASTAAVAAIFHRELARLPRLESGAADASRRRVPPWLVVTHLVFLGLLVAMAHHLVVFLGVFLFFLGVAAVTNEYQDEIQLKEALLVGFFLAGLVVLGGLQSWWLTPVLRSLDAVPLYFGATALTAVTDNAALTYLGAQVPGLSEASRFALLAGAVAGGGLTVIANAPNPAGYGILRDRFPGGAVSPLGLLLAALGPTLVAMACLWWLPDLSI
jgi:hypothetical protein